MAASLRSMMLWMAVWDWARRRWSAASWRAGSSMPRRHEFRFRADDGSMRDIALSVIVKTAGGTIITAFDLTARRNAERAWQDEIARYQDMTTAASDWFFELDRTMTRMRLVRRHAESGSVTLTERSSQWPHKVSSRIGKGTTFDIHLPL